MGQADEGAGHGLSKRWCIWMVENSFWAIFAATVEPRGELRRSVRPGKEAEVNNISPRIPVWGCSVLLSEQCLSVSCAPAVPSLALSQPDSGGNRFSCTLGRTRQDKTRM